MFIIVESSSWASKSCPRPQRQAFWGAAMVDDSHFEGQDCVAESAYVEDSRVRSSQTRPSARPRLLNSTSLRPGRKNGPKQSTMRTSLPRPFKRAQWHGSFGIDCRKGESRSKGKGKRVKGKIFKGKGVEGFGHKGGGKTGKSVPSIDERRRKFAELKSRTRCRLVVKSEIWRGTQDAQASVNLQV